MSATADQAAGIARRPVRGLFGGITERAPRSGLLWWGVGIVGFVIVVSLVVPPLFGFDHPDRLDLLNPLLSPSIQHPFGTDNLGRDVFSRTLAATHLDLGVAAVLTLMSFTIGVTCGALAGYFGGWVEAVFMRVVDVVIAFPFIVLVIAIVSIFGPGLKGVLVGSLVVGWAIYARLTRAEMLVVREREYVLAAKTLGYSNRRVVLRHALPNAIRASVVFSMADFVGNIAILATLSYLGLGVQPPTPEWGAIIAGGQNYLLSAWWISTLPGLVIVLVGVGLSLIGDGLAEHLGREVTPVL